MRSDGYAASLGGPRLLLLCNLLLALAAAVVVWSYDRASHEQRVLRLVERTHADIQNGLDLTVALLRGTTGFVEASEEVTLGEFHDYVATLDLRRRHPSLLGIGYAKRVTPAEVPALERQMRAAGYEDFRVWPTPTGPESTAIIYLEPPDRGNLRAIGFDMMSEPTRRAAMERARDTGATVASGTVTLVQEGGGEGFGFNIYTPHYARDLSHETVDERRRALRGFVYSPVRVREVFGGVRSVPAELAIRVFDGADPGTARLIHEDPVAADLGVSHRRELSVAGRPWAVLYISTAPPFLGISPAAVAVFSAGVLFAGLVYRIQVVQVRARARAERDALAVEEGERRYRSLAASVPQAVFSTDGEGRLTYTNGRWPGIVLGEPLARNLLVSVHPEDRLEAVRAWEGAEAAGAPWSTTFRFWTGDDGNWRWHLAKVLPRTVEGRVVEWVGTLTDIQAQKEAEAALQQHAGELERRVCERTEELERSVRELENYAAVASHDLQEPLRKIVAFGDRLADELGPAIPPGAADALSRMRRSALRLQQLISDLLAFTRISRAEVVATPVDLESLAKEVSDDLLEGRVDGGQVEVRPIPVAAGDPSLLRQLLENLLGNALKFHRPGEPPRVRVYSEPAGDEAPAEERDRWFRLVVEDEGIGFDPKYLERIFQVFQRLHPRDRYEGTGIGLAICQRVVELHGGSITARSAPSTGACFVATLPRAASATINEGCAPSRDEARSSSPRTIPTTVS